MTTRLIVLLLTAGLVGIPVIGVVAPVAAEPFPPAPTSPETVAMPGPPVGSGKGRSAEGSGEVAEMDPWADALAESARLNAVARLRAEFPDYSVALNDDVRYFLDRFTGSRREFVEMCMGRSGRYLAMIREIFRCQGWSTDVGYAATSEGGF